jgi:hypothetical protein
MLTTSAEANNRVCLMDMVNRDNISCAGRCRGEECSAWHWEVVKNEADKGERLGYCGMIGRVERTVRKHPRRTVETTVPLS